MNGVNYLYMHLHRVQNAVMAVALPTEQQYLQLLIDAPQSSPPSFTIPIGSLATSDHALTMHVKESMDIPLTNENVTKEWRNVYVILPTLVSFVMLLVMIIVLYVWRP